MAVYSEKAFTTVIFTYVCINDEFGLYTTVEFNLARDALSDIHVSQAEWYIHPLVHVL